MNKGLINLIVVGVILSAIATFLLLRQPQAPKIELVFPDLATSINEIQQIDIKRFETSYSLKKIDSGWVMPEKNNFPVNISKVRQGLIALTELKFSEAKTSRSENYAKLGVESLSTANAQGTEIHLLGKDNTAEADLILGKKNQAGISSVYFRKPLEEQSWQSNIDIPWENDAAQWLQRSILNIAQVDIQSVTLKPIKGRSLFISKKDRAESNYSLKKIPKKKELSYPSILNTLASPLADLQLDDVVTAAGFDWGKTSTQAIYQCFDGRVIKAKILEREDKVYIAFNISFDVKLFSRFVVAPKEGEKETDFEPTRLGTVNLQNKLGPWVYIIPKSKSDNMKKTLNDLLKDKEVKKS